MADDDNPQRRADDQPAWQFALKAGLAFLGILGAGITIGLLWSPVSTAIDAATTARAERQEMRRNIEAVERDIDRWEYEGCITRAYTTWIACRTVFEMSANVCDERHHAAQEECPRP